MWDVQFVPYGRCEVRVGLSVVGGGVGQISRLQQRSTRQLRARSSFNFLAQQINLNRSFSGRKEARLSCSLQKPQLVREGVEGEATGGECPGGVITIWRAEWSRSYNSQYSSVQSLSVTCWCWEEAAAGK